MTDKQAIEELEDRGVPEIIELIRQMDREIDELKTELDNLRAIVRENEYGWF